MSAEKYILYSWGANNYGQLGLGHTEDKLLPCEVLIDSSQAKLLKQITGGGGHTILLTTEGTVLVCGWNKCGQLGVTSSDSTPSAGHVLSPLPNLPWRVEKVSCGWNHTLCLIEGGGVMAWGSNAFGQLGCPDIDKQANAPVHLSREVFSGCSVTDLSAGLRHSIAVTGEGHVFSWGDGKKGQLGHGSKEVDIHRCPRSIRLLLSSAEKCVAVCAGAFHSVALTKDGSLLTWGLNQHGQCGQSPLTDELKLLDKDYFHLSDTTGCITNIYRPLLVKGIMEALVEVHCGWSHTLAITRGEREVMGWGRCDYGQLGQPSLGTSWNYIPLKIPKLKGIDQMACGSEHNIAIIAHDNGPRIPVTFGWNEHGMCGNGDEGNVVMPTEVPTLSHRVDMPTEVPTLSHGVETLLVGAGAGHTIALVHSYIHQ